jgi:WD40 repeat protein
MRHNFIESSRSGPWYRDIRSESAVHYQERVEALLKRLKNYIDDEVLTGHPIIKAVSTLLDRIETVLSKSGFAINDAEEKTTSSIASHMRGVLFKLEELNKWKPGLIQVLDISTRTVGFESKDHLDYVQFLLFSPNSNILASSSKDRTIRVWDTAKGQCRELLGGHSLIHSLPSDPVISLSCVG